MKSCLAEASMTPLTLSSAMTARVAVAIAAIEASLRTFIERPGISSVRVAMPPVSISVVIMSVMEGSF